eukprot:TRINITY_DN55887_c0_g1_i1.p1 TRINITY_DN55887_c0_g1~~TRINITY_DN55887_c0_g1_i1.p1  ORF type:complete len:118 (-),score=11.74 TRINITY_DN55887_c0_g1_i1:20-373(-)
MKTTIICLSVIAIACVVVQVFGIPMPFIVGGWCEDNDDCIFVFFAQCDKAEKKCVCQDGYQVFNKQCGRAIGQTCDTTNQCMAIGGAWCNSTAKIPTCVCFPDTEYNTKAEKCLPKL